MLLLIDGMFVPCSALLSQPSQLAVPFLRAPSRLQIVGTVGSVAALTRAWTADYTQFTLSVLCATGTHGVPRGVVEPVGLFPAEYRWIKSHLRKDPERGEWASGLERPEILQELRRRYQSRLLTASSTGGTGQAKRAKAKLFIQRQ